MAKRRHKTIRHDDNSAGSTYLSIGHTSPDVIVWAYAGGEILTWHPDEGTHAEVMGAVRDDYWRGRYEGYTNILSFVPPAGTQYRSLPTWLRDKLETYFGDFKPHGFNPAKKRS